MKLEPPVLSAAVGDMVSVLTPDEMAACFTGEGNSFSSLFAIPVALSNVLWSCS